MNDTPKLVLFGDSITQYSTEEPEGVLQLVKRYAGRIDVIVRGFSGYNTAWARELEVKGVTTFPNVAATVIFFGSNDVVPEESPMPEKAQHVSLSSYRENLCFLVSRAAERGPVVVVSPAFFDEREGTRKDSDLDSYVAAAFDVCKQFGIRFINLRAAFANRSELLRDGLHFSPEGYVLFMQLLMNELDSLLGLPDTLQWIAPYWQRIANGDETIGDPE